MPAIDDYLAGLEARDAEIIGSAYAHARALVPDVEQGVSYGMPALIHQGRPLLSVMRAKTHLGIYPYSASVVAAVVEALGPVDGMTSAKGTLRLPLGVPIPEEVVSRLVLTRADEIHAAKAPRRRGAAAAE
ncbi:MAG TPA: DUF1801 domain-containing protein [Propionibacteriaceae bacterium]|nr:DUF1801 domain-containing protein [Propionibacteriaceae bacterium]